MPAPTNAPSKLKVTVGNTTFMPNEDEETDNEDEWEQPPTEQPYQEVKRSRTGRTIHPIKLYQDEYQGVCADSNYYSILNDNEDENDDEYSVVQDACVRQEIANVRARIRGGYHYSSELRVLNYKQAMASKEKEKWKNEIKKENECIKNTMFGSRCQRRK